MPEIKEKVIKILEDQIYTSAQPHNKLSDLGLDSLNVIEIVMELEWELGVVMTDEEAEDLFTNKTVKELIEFIEKALKE